MSKGKGSSEQILDLIDRGGIKQINDIINDKSIVITSDDWWYPKSKDKPKEVSILTFLKSHSNLFNINPSYINEFKTWWVVYKGKFPTWDYIASATINGKKGIVLIEAKSHVDEFDTNGKKIKETASEASHVNHKQITEAIEKARDSINKLNRTEIKISIDNCYQLSNRIAQSWWLASHGIPVTLVYLGFIGDTSMANNYKIFMNESEWKVAVENYFSIVDCKELIEIDIRTKSAPFKIITRVASTHPGQHL